MVFIKRTIVPLVCILLMFSSAVSAEVDAVLSQGLGLGANDLGDITSDGSTIWVSGSGTVTKKIGGTGHLANDWWALTGETGFGKGSMGSLFATNKFIIASWIYDEIRNGESVRNGDGFSISYDKGVTWKHVSILELFPDRAGLKYPGTLTLTYDFAYSGGTLWAATTAGYLVSSNDLGKTWKNIIPLPDTTMVFQNPNHHGQCVDAYADTVWVGTFQGMNASFDHGKTWTNFSWSSEDAGNPLIQKPGNFCYSVEHQYAGGKTYVWVGCSPYGNLGKYGICCTSDNGATWEFKTTKYNAWNFAFGRNGANNPEVTEKSVFAASDDGLIVSHDLGETWKVITIAESDNSYKWETGKRVYGLTAVEDTLWVTSSDGVAMSPDWGNTWNIFKGVTRVRTLDTGARNVGLSTMFDNERTYAFPNPFSPKRSDQDYSRTRIQYALTDAATISISIYDYTGRQIRELLTNESRAGGRDYQEIWDGRDGDREIVPNGVYFYIIKTNKGDSARGKIMVVD